MSQRDARLQVPMDQKVIDELHALADELGFDSVPAMVRFWAKGEIAKRQQSSQGPNQVVLRYLELILALNPEPGSPDAALRHLFNKLRQARFQEFFKDLPHRPTSDKIFDT